MSTSKRAADDTILGGQPPPKKVQFEPTPIGPISTLEEMDFKVIQFQNKKLSQRLEQRYLEHSKLTKTPKNETTNFVCLRFGATLFWLNFPIF